MSTSQAEVEVQWVKNTLLPELLKNKYFREDNSLRDDSTQDNVKIRDVHLKFIGSEEAFMLTTCYRAFITFEEDNGGTKTTTVIVKKTPVLPQEIFDTIQFGPLFNNEILTYNTILPAIEKFAQQTFNASRLYFGELHKNSATVALQDFATDNWRLCEQKVNLSLAHALAAVTNLGTLHGLGFALRYKNRAEFERLTSELKESRYSVDDIVHPEWKLKTKIGPERVVIAAQKYQPHIDEEFLKRYQRLAGEFILYGRKMVAPIEPLVTLCHGDYLRSNIAFKYSHSNGTEEPIDSLMFDLQTTRVSSPMLDFCTYLCLSANAAVRHKHFDKIFDTYYNQLISTFTKSTHETHVPDFLSRASFLREYGRLFPYSVSIAAYFLMQLVDPPNINSQKLSLQTMNLDDVRSDSYMRGGDEVDRELAHQMREIYELVQKYKLDIFEGFD